jgi:propionate catabolism operon transcriptional regulator
MESRSALPRILVISYKGLSRIAEGLIDEFRERAQIQLIDVVLDEALERARAAERAQSADVIVTAGANATFLRSALQIPVVEVKVSGYDVMLALMRARTVSERVGVVTYRETIPELNAIKELLRIEIAQRTYRTIEDCHNCFHSLRAEGIEVIVGSSLVVELARQNQIEGILTYSPTSVRQAFEHAIDLSHLAQLKSSRFEQLKDVLHHLREAVLAVDSDERITAINDEMQRLLSVTERSCIGVRLASVAPELRVSDVLRTGMAELDAVIQLRSVTCIANITPIRERSTTAGAVISLQDARRIELAETNLRTQRRSKSLLARYHFDQIIGSSAQLNHAREVAQRYARTHSTVLISGESGTGKELFAQAIHNASPRRTGPFVAVNCASLPEPLLESELFGYEEGAFTGTRRGGRIGLFESAHRGTIFLDEVGDMPLALQTRLLRVLQEKEVTRLGSTQPIPVDVRIVAATHQDLLQLVRAGQFRDDLYYRLNILRLRLPTLRERGDDIAFLALQFLFQALRRLGSSLAADQALAPIMPLLKGYPWPGNVRELENVAERLAVFLSDYARASDINYSQLSGEFAEIFAGSAPDAASRPMNGLPGATHASVNPAVHALDPILADRGNLSGMASRERRRRGGQELATLSRQDIERILSESGGNHSIAARRLGISRTTLWRKLRPLSS